MRTDPSDNGGLFVGRRPGTAPVRFRSLPERGSETRQRVDGSLAGVMLAAHHAAVPAVLGADPDRLPVARLAGQLPDGQRQPRHPRLVRGLFALLFGALSLMQRLDNAWILVRRAAGHDQRTGVLGRIFAGTAAICALAFLFWFLVIHGPGTSLVVRGGGPVSSLAGHAAPTPLASARRSLLEQT